MAGYKITEQLFSINKTMNELAKQNFLYNAEDFKNANALDLGDTYNTLMANQQNATIRFNDAFYKRLDTETKLEYLYWTQMTDRTQTAVDDYGNEYNVSDTYQEYFNNLKKDFIKQDIYDSSNILVKGLSGLLDFWGEMFAGMWDIVEGLGDLLVMGGVAIADIFGLSEEDKSKALEFVAGSWSGNQSFRDALDDFSDKYSWLSKNEFGKFVKDASYTIGQLAPAVIPGIGGGLYFSGIGGISMEQAAQYGVSDEFLATHGHQMDYKTALLYGVEMAGIEATIGKLSKLIKPTGLDKLLFGKLGANGLSSTAGQILNKTVGKPLATVLANITGDFALEATEEMVTEVVDTMIWNAQITGDPAFEGLTMGTIIRAGLLGGLIGSVVSGIKVGSTEQLVVNRDGSIVALKDATKEQLATGATLTKSQSVLLADALEKLNANISSETVVLSDADITEKTKETLNIQNEALVKSSLPLVDFIGKIGGEEFKTAFTALANDLKKQSDMIRNYVTRNNVVTKNPKLRAKELEFESIFKNESIKIADGISTAEARLRNYIKDNFGVDVLFVTPGSADGLSSFTDGMMLDDETMLIESGMIGKKGGDYAVDVVKYQLVKSLQMQHGVVTRGNLAVIDNIINPVNIKVTNNPNQINTNNKKEFSERQTTQLLSMLLFDNFTASRVFRHNRNFFVKTYNWLKDTGEKIKNSRKTADKIKFSVVSHKVKEWRELVAKAVSTNDDIKFVAQYMNLTPDEVTQLIDSYTPIWFDDGTFNFGIDHNTEVMRKRDALYTLTMARKVDAKEPFDFTKVFNPEYYKANFVQQLDYAGQGFTNALRLALMKQTGYSVNETGLVDIRYVANDFSAEFANLFTKGEITESDVAQFSTLWDILNADAKAKNVGNNAISEAMDIEIEWNFIEGGRPYSKYSTTNKKIGFFIPVGTTGTSLKDNGYSEEFVNTCALAISDLTSIAHSINSFTMKETLGKTSDETLRKLWTIFKPNQQYNRQNAIEQLAEKVSEITTEYADTSSNTSGFISDSVNMYGYGAFKGITINILGRSVSKLSKLRDVADRQVVAWRQKAQDAIARKEQLDQEKQQAQTKKATPKKTPTKKATTKQEKESKINIQLFGKQPSGKSEQMTMFDTTTSDTTGKSTQLSFLNGKSLEEFNKQQEELKKAQDNFAKERANAIRAEKRRKKTEKDFIKAQNLAQQLTLDLEKAEKNTKTAENETKAVNKELKSTEKKLDKTTEKLEKANETISENADEISSLNQKIAELEKTNKALLSKKPELSELAKVRQVVPPINNTVSNFLIRLEEFYFPSTRTGEVQFVDETANEGRIVGNMREFRMAFQRDGTLDNFTPEEVSNLLDIFEKTDLYRVGETLHTTIVVTINTLTTSGKYYAYPELQERLEKFTADILNKAGRDLSLWGKLLAKSNPLGNISHELHLAYGIDLHIDDRTRLTYDEAISKNNGEAIVNIEKSLTDKIEKAFRDKKIQGTNPFAKGLTAEERNTRISNFIDKVNAIRYLFMLSNPSTHVANIVSNSFIKILTAGVNGIESIISKHVKYETGELKYTPDEKITDNEMQAVEIQFGALLDRITATGKYDYAQSLKLEESRLIEDGKHQAMYNSALFKTLDHWINDISLSGGDRLFTRKALLQELTRLIKANYPDELKWSVDNLDNEYLEYRNLHTKYIMASFNISEANDRMVDDKMQQLKELEEQDTPESNKEADRLRLELKNESELVSKKFTLLAKVNLKDDAMVSAIVNAKTFSEVGDLELRVEESKFAMPDVINKLNEKHQNISKMGFSDEKTTEMLDIATRRVMTTYLRYDNKAFLWWNNIANKNAVTKVLFGGILPFPRVATNLAIQFLRYSPLALARGCINLFRRSINKDYLRKEFSDNMVTMITNGTLNKAFFKAQAIDDLSHGAIGTSLMITGIVLTALGIIGIDDDDEYNGYVLNVGNVKFKLSDLAPAITPILVGGALVSGFEDSRWDGVLKAFRTAVSDNTLIGSFDSILKYNDDFFSVVGNSIGTYFTQYVPAVFRALQKATDPKTSVNYQTNFIVTTLERMISGIPFASRLLPSKVDAYTGENEKAYNSKWAAIFNILSPVSISIGKADPVRLEAYNIKYETTPATGRFTINATDYALTGSERTEFQRNRGAYVNYLLGRIINNTTPVKVLNEEGTYDTKLYSNLSNTQKNNVFGTTYSKASNYAKINWWVSQGHKYYTNSKDEYNDLLALGIKAFYSKNVQGSKFKE